MGGPERGINDLKMAVSGEGELLIRRSLPRRCGCGETKSANVAPQCIHWFADGFRDSGIFSCPPIERAWFSFRCPGGV